MYIIYVAILYCLFVLTTKNLEWYVTLHYLRNQEFTLLRLR